MKQLLFFVFLGIITISAFSQTTKVQPVLKVYYFHNTHRCPGCIAIETETKKVLEESFASEVKNGKIAFYTYNAEDAANKEIIKKYQVWGSSLLLISVKDGKEYKTDMTDTGFSYARNNPDKFKAELKSKINALIKS